MAFDTPFFLFLLLPLILLVMFIVPQKHKFAVLLLCSVIFYWWIEPALIIAAAIIAIWSYWIGFRISKTIKDEKKAKKYLLLGVIANIICLVAFKIVSFQFTGVSFLVFVALAYIFDIYNQRINPEHNIWRYLFHVFFFPKVASGPIMRYEQTSNQFENIRLDVRQGVIRFIIGISKKVLLANALGVIADGVFNLSTDALTTPIAWLGAISYALQIYYDFSGYTDMAIGLGRFFGFVIPENFNHPYLATGIVDFWRRWHITLSSWFRDYVFMPLEYGRRKSSKKWRQYLNILIVFALTGLWHGIGLPYLIWGLIHGCCIVFETMFAKFFKRLWRPIKHIYALFAIFIGWVFFRASSITHALDFLYSMFGFKFSESLKPLLSLYLTPYNMGIIIIGIILILPWKNWWDLLVKEWPVAIHTWILKPVSVLGILLLFALSVMAVADSTYQAFIYSQF